MPAPIVINDVMRSSFRCISQLRPGFGHSPSELIDGLFILNAMLDSWSTDDLNCSCELIQSFLLVASKRSYTIGVGADWDGQRPVKIDKATLVILTNPTQPLREDMESLNEEQYQRIKLQLTESPMPRSFWYNPTTTWGTIYIHPVPSEANRVELTSSQALANGFLLGTDAFVVPPGYLDAIRYQLAIRLAMEWDKPLKEGVLALAIEALAKIQRVNAPTPQMQVNPGVMPIRSGQGGFNRFTGE